ncbi:hypothetical protein PG988_004486 [Apiospora saccharicola]
MFDIGQPVSNEQQYNNTMSKITTTVPSPIPGPTHHEPPDADRPPPVRITSSMSYTDTPDSTDGLPGATARPMAAAAAAYAAGLAVLYM